MNSGLLYVPDVTSIKKYGEKYKLTYYNIKRQKGIEDEKLKPENEKNDYKLENSISRSKAKVYEYGLCNKWSYFVTLTLNKSKHDRYDLPGFIKSLGSFLYNYTRNKSKADRIRYLLLPEKHKNGAWHMHGLMSNIPAGKLRNNKNGYLDWPDYGKRFGYISLDPIKEIQKISAYILKYVGKGIQCRRSEMNKKMYYCTKGLKVSELIFEGSLNDNEINFDYENKYVKIKWFDSADEAMSCSRQNQTDEQQVIINNYLASGALPIKQKGDI